MMPVPSIQLAYLTPLRRDELGADIAFAQSFLVESWHLRKHLSAKGFGGEEYPSPLEKSPRPFGEVLSYEFWVLSCLAQY